LHSVTADNVETGELKAVFRVAHPAWAGHDIAENVRFAAARRARASAPQERQLKKGFRAVVPLNGKFIADLLDVGWFQTHGLFATGRIRPSANRSYHDVDPESNLRALVFCGGSRHRLQCLTQL
jgi:hypothetical protein